MGDEGADEETLEVALATKATVEETKRNTLYSWLNCNPVYVLKCKYWVLDEDGYEIAVEGEDDTRRKSHPLACGEDPLEVRFFEVGKQYLFFKPGRLSLVYQGGYQDSLEFETWFEWILDGMGTMTALCGEPTTRATTRKKTVWHQVVQDDLDLVVDSCDPLMIVA